MLKSLQIKNFRGIVEGKIEGLAPLSILVGANGQGKSTVLEAAHLFASAPDVRQLHRVALRRGWYGSGTWQFLSPANGASKESSDIFRFKLDGIVEKSSEEVVEIGVAGWGSSSRQLDLLSQATKEGVAADIQIGLELTGGKDGQMETIISANGEMATPTIKRGTGETALASSALLDVNGFAQPGMMEAGLSASTVGGWLDDVLKVARAVIPNLADLRLVKLHGNTVAMLYFGSGKPSIPIHVAGDGVRRIIEHAQFVLGGPPGLVVIEEPENFLHPGARRISANILWAAVERGEQVIISTHNLDLLDDIISDKDASALESLCVFRTSLSNGVLHTERIRGNETKEAREILGQDLRV